MTETYLASNFGKKEEEMMRLFHTQRDDAKHYFVNYVKPRLDRSYKLYIADNSDRAKEIKSWQANVVVPYIHAVVETLKPRILDARPDFSVQGRNEDDQAKASKLQSLGDYTWEVSSGDKSAELLVSSCLIYGTGYLQVSWKKDERTQEFLVSKDVSSKTLKYKKKTRVFYDAPYMEWVDNYALWYDWRNINAESKQFWFKRLVLTNKEIERRYPLLDKKRLKMALKGGAGDLTDYAAVKNQVKKAHEKITKGSDYRSASIDEQPYANADITMHEVFEWWRPFDDRFAVMVNDVPVLKGGEIPIPYDFKESPFIPVQYLRIPGEFEGYGVPMILENPQIMLNMLKNQRLDAMTLNIHKMWIVNPLANINKNELVVKPFGIIYSSDPNGAREISSSDIKPSAYREEEMLKSDMRYSSGVDDFSMGAGGGSASATEVRHLRESTLERVRLFINHLGEAYSTVLRYWISMYRQFAPRKMIIRVLGEDGKALFPLIQKDDLMGEFDFKATVIPSIAGQNDIKKKQDMDLLQLLMNVPTVDQDKLISKVLHDFSWDFESIRKQQEENPMDTLGQSPEELIGETDMLGGAPVGNAIPPDIAKQALAMLGSNMGGDTGYASGPSPIAEMSRPVNLLTSGNLPPTPKGVSKTSNPRGMNRTGKVNTNIPLRENYSEESKLMNRVNNIQR